MPSSYTTRNRLTLQATGEGANTWGVILNNGVFSLVDFAMDGIVTISAGGTTTLSSANGSTDQSRGRIINVTASAQANIVIPSVEKWYIVRAATVDAVLGISGATSGNQATVKAGDIALVFCDGSITRKVQSNDFAGAKIRNIADGTADQDAVSYKQLIETAFATQAGDFPGLADNKRKSLQPTEDETSVFWNWANLKPLASVTGNYTAVHQDRLAINTASGPITLTLPASPSAGDCIFFKDGNAAPGQNGFAANNLTIARNGQTIGGVAENATVNRRGTAGMLEFLNGTWEVTVLG